MIRINNKFAAAVIALLCVTGCTNQAQSDNSSTQTVFSTAQAFQTSSESSEISLNSDDTQNDVLYDTSPISTAYLSGDSSGLDELQLKILDKAQEVISQTVTDQMSDYEKELAIHDYIISHVEYDVNMLGIFQTHAENSVNPYGALYDAKAICSGYTTTFQMFMDMLEIPCISIYAADLSDEQHAWNMVEINDEWYYVDVTWDDPVPDEDNRLIRHKYFNVTEEYMKTKHVWDSQQLPQADSYDDSYVAHNLFGISEYEQMLPIITSALESGSENVYFSIEDKQLSRTDDIDTFLSPDSIDDELAANDKFAALMDSCMAENGLTDISCQRIKFNDQIVLALYLQNT